MITIKSNQIFKSNQSHHGWVGVFTYLFYLGILTSSLVLQIFLTMFSLTAITHAVPTDNLGVILLTLTEAASPGFYQDQ